jgi:hypothetical protein
LKLKLKALLDAGLSVIGTKYDKKPGMADMSQAAQKRHGYVGADEFWTERGWNRATTADHDKMARSTRARAKNGLK